MSSLPFWKMEGCANDFVVVYRADLPPSIGPSSAPRLCDRRLGIGADGVIVIDRGPLGSTGAGSDCIARMTVWNADGSLAEMCGNGLRCLVQRMVEDGTWPESGSANVLTDAGTVPCSRVGESIRLVLGQPTLLDRQPLRVQAGGFEVDGYRVSMGNPHFVVFAEPGVDLLPDLTEWGPSLESAPVFPERSNIEWVQFEAPDRLRVRVWERGVGETQACGSGACAVAVAARASARSDKDTMTVLLPGGALRVHWAGTQEEPVSLEGPARTVFHGSWRLDS